MSLEATGFLFKRSSPGALFCRSQKGKGHVKSVDAKRRMYRSKVNRRECRGVEGGKAGIISAVILCWRWRVSNKTECVPCMMYLSPFTHYYHYANTMKRKEKKVCPHRVFWSLYALRVLGTNNVGHANINSLKAINDSKGWLFFGLLP